MCDLKAEMLHFPVEQDNYLTQQCEEKWIHLEKEYKFQILLVQLTSNLKLLFSRKDNNPEKEGSGI